MRDESVSLCRRREERKAEQRREEKSGSVEKHGGCELKVDEVDEDEDEEEEGNGSWIHGFMGRMVVVRIVPYGSYG